jgi:hypothetical protein
MNIAFHSNQLSLRGTEVALYDYANYNETILGNRSIIISKDISVWPYSDVKAIEKFKNRFDVFLYKNFNEVESILNNKKIDVFYAQKAGFNDGVISKGRKTVIHSVFQYYEPHGDVYAYISNWLGDQYNSPSVPYIVNLPKENGNLRLELGIPEGALVFGRHGGKETFDIPMAIEAVIEVANENPNIYFIFMYTDKFIDLPNVIHLEGSSDLHYKVKFINTCNAMLHARKVGETFGLAIAEFSMRNKPVITYGGSMRDNAHISMLGDKAIKYKSKSDLINILINFKNTNKDCNIYKDYNPEKIMHIFNDVFLK